MSTFMRDAVTSELNTLAAHWAAGEQVPRHTPSNHTYWFFALSGEAPMGDLDLSDDARKLFGYCDRDDCYACASDVPRLCTHRSES